MKQKASLVTGKLYLIPTTLGDTAPLEVLPISVKRAIERIDHYIVENEKTARRFIKKIISSKSQSDLVMEVLNKFTDPAMLPSFLDPCLQGLDVGLISEAGCPGIADPGAEITLLAHQKGIKVVPMAGPSSILMAMMSSGLNGQNFAFNGYLPIDATERKEAIKSLEKKSKALGQSQIFIETPYRNEKLLDELKKRLKPTTLLCLAVDITLPEETIITQSVEKWNSTSLNLNKRPAIFILLAQ